MTLRLRSNERMSQIVVHDGTVYLSGQVAGPDAKGVAEQTRSVLDKIEALLDEAGSGTDRILSATIYLTDMKDFAAMNEVWDAWLPVEHAPARACVEARLARESLLVEITIIATTA